MKRTIGDTARSIALGATVLCLLGAASQQAAAEIYAYPMNKQSAKQQQTDEIECMRWASDRTGFDPRRPPQYVGGGGYAAPPPQQSGFFGRGSYGEGGGILDAGKGAGLGAIGGAIAGNAGAGAAIGALSGLFIGGVKRSSQAAEREAWERQQAQQQAQQRREFENRVALMHADFDRAYIACMEGRGYRVK